MLVTKSTINAAVGAAGVSLIISSEIGAVLLGIAVQYARGSMLIACDILFSLIILSFFAGYCRYAYRVERKLQLQDLPQEQDNEPEIAAR
ncbi:hypothetical protein [Cohaesibacter haloalkalitolerans]|uniref:hypothetical protein n=1 Tax=Cohaesibacter haloalkalitolerans TaxID=1162980 RepID=UPI000E6521F6|nr:hypothetical protein [Cohaesibacter haloalkalitolerans]